MPAGARPLDPAGIRFDPQGLIAAVVQDAEDGRVLMVGWQDAEAVEATLRTGEVHFHSRSRDVLWRKGETSGNTIAVEALELDCDADSVLIRARPAGPTCHTGVRSCFDLAPGKVGPPAEADSPTVLQLDARSAGAHEDGADQGFAWLERLWGTIADRAVRRPFGSYTTRLLDRGVDAVARKVAEEAIEVVLAAKDDAAAQATGGERPRGALAGELADLLYHALVLCAERGLEPRDVIAELEARRKA